jgi:hypothetical protein
MKTEAAMEDIHQWHDASELDGFGPVCNEFIWNANFSKFRVIPLRWWDEPSYLKYQSVDPVREDGLTQPTGVAP